jgi:hypothetical protein
VRAQEAINRQLIDKADIIVAIFWSRFGSPTGVADSGTVEEIERGIRKKKTVMVYFSDLEPLPPDTRTAQLELLENFKSKMTGLWSAFQSRQKFKELFAGHLVAALDGKRPRESRRGRVEKTTGIKQVVTGNKNITAAGDVIFNGTPIVEERIERPVDGVTDPQILRIKERIKELVDLTTGKTQGAAFQMWWSRFYNRFGVTKCEKLPASRFEEVEAWSRQQRAIATRGLKRKAPDTWKNARYGAIKMAMTAMGRTNDNYYPELSLRLKIRPPFSSLTELTKTDLERVYTAVLRDQGGR